MPSQLLITLRQFVPINHITPNLAGFSRKFLDQTCCQHFPRNFPIKVHDSLLWSATAHSMWTTISIHRPYNVLYSEYHYRGHECRSWPLGKWEARNSTGDHMLMNYIVTQLGHNVYYKSPKKVQTRSENSSPLTLMSDDEEDVDKVQIAPLSHTHLKMCLLWSMISLTQHLQYYTVDII